MEGLRRCSICKQDKAIGDFRKLKNGRSSHCKPCAAAYLREWRANNPDRLKEHARARRANPEYQNKHRIESRKYYEKNPDAYRERNLRQNFGITLDEYREMEAAQDGKCAVCGEKCKSGRSLAVDHNHETGEIRALLCMNCNRAIGWMQDDPDRLMAAAAYLLRYQDVLELLGDCDGR